jgi:hypothetical protein
LSSCGKAKRAGGAVGNSYVLEVGDRIAKYV